MTDNVNHPSHYERFRFTCEPKDFTKFLPHPLASAVEYFIRAPHKGNEVEDLQKAVFWLHELLTTDYYWDLGDSRNLLYTYASSVERITEFRAVAYGLACKCPEISELLCMEMPERITKVRVERFLDYIGDRIAMLLNGVQKCVSN